MPSRSPVLQADEIGVHGLLPTTSLTCAPGDRVVVLGPPGPAAVALALALAGRLRTDTGTVTLDGDPAPEPRQRAVALVDLPTVTEPEPGVPLRTLIAEELALAGRRATRRTAQGWLAEHGAAEAAPRPVRDLDGLARIEMLTELAAARTGVTHLLLATPERHGVPGPEWLAVAQRAADRGFGVIATVTSAVAQPEEAHVIIGGSAA